MLSVRKTRTRLSVRETGPGCLSGRQDQAVRETRTMLSVREIRTMLSVREIRTMLSVRKTRTMLSVRETGPQTASRIKWHSLSTDFVTECKPKLLDTPNSAGVPVQQIPLPSCTQQSEPQSLLICHQIR